MEFSILGSGKEFGFVTLLTLQTSEQNPGVISDFGTSRQDDAQREQDGSLWIEHIFDLSIKILVSPDEYDKTSV